MKPALERTSISCRDLAEQTEREYVLIVPEHQLAVYCDEVEVREGAINGIERDHPERPLVSLHPNLGWIVLRNDLAERTSRGQALRRVVENQLAESEHV